MKGRERWEREGEVGKGGRGEKGRERWEREGEVGKGGRGGEQREGNYLQLL